MQSQTITVGSVFSEAWEIFKREWKVLVGFFILAAIINLLVSAGGYTVDFNPVTQEWITAGSPAVSLIGWLIGIVLGAMGLGISILVARNEQVSWEAVKSFIDFKSLFFYFLVSLLVGILTVLGLLLLIVPGIYVAITYMLATYIVLDKKSGPIEAMKHSARAVQGYRWTLLAVLGSIFLLNLLGALMFMIGLLVTIPLSMAAAGVVYVRLVDGQTTDVVSGDTDDEVIEVEEVEEGDTSQ